MLEIQSLVKRYGRSTVLDGVVLSLAPGSLNVMVGANGAGKSTLLRMMAQLERPTRGQMRLHGQPVDPCRVGYLPQNLQFHPLLTVGQILQFYAEVWSCSTEATQAALVRWGLEGHSRKPTAQLSGGLRQRLGLAVLSLRPVSLLLLDEPGLSLDPDWRDHLRAWLVQMAREGAIVLVTTHLLEEWHGAHVRNLNCIDGKVVDLPCRSEATLQHVNDA